MHSNLRDEESKIVTSNIRNTIKFSSFVPFLNFAQETTETEQPLLYLSDSKIVPRQKRKTSKFTLPKLSPTVTTVENNPYSA